MATPQTRPEPQPPTPTPPGWYPNPQGAGQRYWDGQRWTDQYSQPPAAGGLFKEAFLADSRVVAGALVARISAFLLLAGFIGSIATWGKHDSIFEMASTASKTYRPGGGFVVGPLLIIGIVPFVHSGVHRFAYKQAYQARVVISALLFVAGLIVLGVSLGNVDPDATVKAGTYISAVLLCVGLAATLAMWPSGLKAARVDKAGRIEEEAD